MDSRAVVAPHHAAGPMRLRPFRALSLAPRHAGDPAAARLFARPFRAIPDRLDRWERAGDLVHDREPAVYLHEYTAGGITVRGLVGALEVSRRVGPGTERVVFPHEGVRPAQVEQLAARMEVMGLNPAPILLVHRATPDLRRLVRLISGAPPASVFTDRAGQLHRLWPVRDREVLDGLDAAIAHARALIADGHHRYEAYLRLEQDHPDAAHAAGLAMLVDHEDTPLFLGAIHRVLDGVTLEELLEAAGTVVAGTATLPERSAVAALGPDTLVVTDGSGWAEVRLRHEDLTPVEQLHSRLLPRLTRPPAAVHFHHGVDETLTRVRSGGGLAVLLPAAGVDQVLASAAAGRLLPEKATSFQPKPTPGVLMRSLRDE